MLLGVSPGPKLHVHVCATFKFKKSVRSRSVPVIVSIYLSSVQYWPLLNWQRTSDGFYCYLPSIFSHIEISEMNNINNQYLVLTVYLSFQINFNFVKILDKNDFIGIYRLYVYKDHITKLICFIQHRSPRAPTKPFDGGCIIKIRNFCQRLLLEHGGERCHRAKKLKMWVE